MLLSSREKRLKRHLLWMYLLNHWKKLHQLRQTKPLLLLHLNHLCMLLLKPRRM